MEAEWDVVGLVCLGDIRAGTTSYETGGNESREGGDVTESTKHATHMKQSYRHALK